MDLLTLLLDCLRVPELLIPAAVALAVRTFCWMRRGHEEASGWAEWYAGAALLVVLHEGHGLSGLPAPTGPENISPMFVAGIALLGGEAVVLAAVASALLAIALLRRDAERRPASLAQLGLAMGLGGLAGFVRLAALRALAVAGEISTDAVRHAPVWTVVFVSVGVGGAVLLGGAALGAAGRGGRPPGATASMALPT